MSEYIVISTVGTSFLRKNFGLLANPPASQLNKVSKKDPRDRECGSEINSIHLILAKQNWDLQSTRLFFLVSDTEEGKWMGKFLEAYYCDKALLAEAKLVGGLTHYDPKKFSRTGLRNLVLELSKIVCDRINTDEAKKYCAINATGGYKAQIAFAAVVGQTLNLPVYYLFEEFNDIIKLEPLPIDFDRDLWITHYGLFSKLSKEEAILENEIDFKEVDSRVRDLLDKTDIDGKYYFAMSPILELMHQGFLMRWPQNVKLASSSIPLGERVQLKPSEMPHAPKGTKEFAEKLAKLEFIKKISSIKFVNALQTHVLSRRDTKEPGEIQVQYADQNKGIILALKTTAKNDEEFDLARECVAKDISD